MQILTDSEKQEIMDTNHLLIEDRYTKEQIIHAENLRKELRETGYEHTHLSEELRAEKEGSLLRLNKVQAKLSELHIALRDAPPKPISPTEAITEIADLLQRRIYFEYATAKRRFLKYCDADSVVAVCLKDMMVCRARALFFMPLQMELTCKPDIEKLREVMEEVNKRITDTCSSNPTDPVGMYNQEAALRVMQETCLVGIFDMLNDIFVGVEVWEMIYIGEKNE